MKVITCKNHLGGHPTSKGGWNKERTDPNCGPSSPWLKYRFLESALFAPMESVAYTVIFGVLDFNHRLLEAFHCVRAGSYLPNGISQDTEGFRRLATSCCLVAG